MFSDEGLIVLESYLAIPQSLFLKLRCAAAFPTGLGPLRLNLGIEAARQPEDVDIGIKILFAMTLLINMAARLIIRRSERGVRG